MLKEIMETRRSVRRFKPDPVPRAVIEDVLAAAITAPSASNKQPWRFFVVDDRPVIDRMAESVAMAIDRIARHVEPDFEPRFRTYGDYFVRFREAPVVIVPACRDIVVLSNLVNGEIQPEDLHAIRDMETSSGLTSTALAIQNLLLYAHSIGLGASCMTGPLVAEARLRELLRIPASWRIAALIPLGVPDEVPLAPERKTVESVIRWVK